MKGRPAVITLILLGTAILALLFLAAWRLRVIVSSPIERAPIDFEAMQRTGSPNDYLVCPPNLCRASADEPSPVFDVPVSRLQEEWLALVRCHPRIKRLTRSEGSKLEFVQRTGLMNFPDTITVRFYALDGNRSTLAVYSRSHYGYYDLGVNRRRVRSWLSELEQRLVGKEVLSKARPRVASQP